MISRFTTTVLTALIIVAISGAVRTASAQTFTNPPCPDVTILNNGLCPVRVDLQTNPPGLWTGISLNPTVATTRPVPPGGITVTGIISAAGIVYPFNPPPPTPGVNCGPGMYWAHAITLGPPPGCCFDICIDPENCIIYLNKLAILPPPPCNP